MKRWPFILLVAIVAFAATQCMHAGEAGLIRIHGAISPATANYISRAVDVANARDNLCLIIELDTPGGLLESTKEIVQKFYSSKVPTVVFVAPSGANAGSAGCFITMAADIAAMAPNTSIGAAHPVLSGAGGSEKLDDVMKQKLENFATSYIEAIADRRGRNVEWARASVAQSASITSEKALELNVIDLIAADIPELLQKLDGREVNKKALSTSGARVVEIPMVMREHLFQFLGHPQAMLFLMMVAIFGIIGEMNAPGAILPGVVGGIALILVLYLAAVLPVNAAGLALIGLSVILFLADVFAPTHGVLTFGGVISFFLGAIMLFNRSDPVFHLSLAYIIPATLLIAGFFIFVIGAGLRAQRLPNQAGVQLMMGKSVPAVEPIDNRHGKVFIEGEYWNAVSEVPVEAGQEVEIVKIEGLTLRVKPKQLADSEKPS